MLVYLVILSVTVYVVSGNYGYHWSTYNGHIQHPVSWNYRDHRTLHQPVYFSTMPNRYQRQLSPIPLGFKKQITVHTSFNGAHPTNVYQIPPFWNSQQHRRPFGPAPPTWQNNIKFHHGFHVQPHNQFHNLNVNGHIVVENLHGKFEDFIKPDLSPIRPSVLFPQSVQPPLNQGGPYLHGHPTTSQWLPSEDTSIQTTSQGVPYNINNMELSSTSTKAPFINKNQLASTSSPNIPYNQATTVSPGGQQQENTSNGDDQYDIDVRSDTE